MKKFIITVEERKNKTIDFEFSMSKIKNKQFNKMEIIGILQYFITNNNIKTYEESNKKSIINHNK